VRDAGAELPVLLRVAEEIDDLAQLGLRLLDPRDVVEGDRSPDGSYARARERPNEPRMFCTLPARAEPEEQEDEEDRRAKPSRRLCHQGAPVSSGCALTTTFFSSSSAKGVVVGEGGNLRLGSASSASIPERSRSREGALDRRALRRDLLDVPSVT
jgi:hypothetical protein